MIFFYKPWHKVHTSAKFGKDGQSALTFALDSD